MGTGLSLRLVLPETVIQDTCDGGISATYLKTIEGINMIIGLFLFVAFVYIFPDNFGEVAALFLLSGLVLLPFLIVAGA